MNKILYKTSILFLTCYLLILGYYWNPDYAYLYIATLVGFAISICNHGDIIPHACPIDRFYMILLAMIYIYTFYDRSCINSLIVISLSILNLLLLYAYSKTTHSVNLHILLHVYAFVFVSAIAIILYHE